MEPKRNYLLGHGEKLASNEHVKLGFGEGRVPYTFGEAKANVTPLISNAVKVIDALPREACPHDEVVAAVVLHPKYISKSEYPKDLLKAAGLRAVGSKSVTVTPKKSHLKSKPKPSATTELFVAGPRANFRALSGSIRTWSSSTPGADDIVKIEDLRVPLPAERIKPIHSKALELFLEVVLYAGENRNSDYILKAFREYMKSLEIDINLSLRIDTEELSFLPVRAGRNRINDLAKFSFLRVAREMPRLRKLSPLSAGGGSARSFPCAFPSGEALDPTIRVAVFDGGHVNIPAMSKWVRRIKGEGVIGPVAEHRSHGTAVTSALLFGPLDPKRPPAQPYAQVDHYRVLDEETENEPQASLYPVLKRIVSVLEREKYDFVNLSIGPAIPIDDDDVHPWTAKIDPLLASSKALAAVAVGNDGESNAAFRLNRIQPPADCVNALSVGSSDGVHGSWARAPYSCVGHGRCPGVMKPDGLAFGGASGSPFWVVDAHDSSKTRATMGTSFAAPNALRAAIGVRAHLGPVMSPLALKALLIHNSRPSDHHSSEVGWGLLPTDIEELITCATSTATVVYQGELDPKKFLRAMVPMPKKLMPGLVTIKATICILTDTDPQHPLTYTRSGLQIFFRKDRSNVPAGKVNPKSSGFFKTGVGMPEQLIRNDAHQWETVRCATKRMRARDLKEPCFDIHYNPREEGHDAAGAKIPYAMIVTITAPRVSDLFEQIFDRYRFQLAELKPKLQLPIQIR